MELVVRAVDDRGYAADGSSAARGDVAFDLGVLPERVLVGVQQGGEADPERRDPLGIGRVQMERDVDKAIAVPASAEVDARDVEVVGQRLLPATLDPCARVLEDVVVRRAIRLGDLREYLLSPIFALSGR